MNWVFPLKTPKNKPQILILLPIIYIRPLLMRGSGSAIVTRNFNELHDMVTCSAKIEGDILEGAANPAAVMIPRSNQLSQTPDR